MLTVAINGMLVINSSRKCNFKTTRNVLPWKKGYEKKKKKIHSLDFCPKTLLAILTSSNMQIYFVTQEKYDDRLQ